MTPAKFTESNGDLLKPVGYTDEQCGTLPVFRDGTYIISKWKLSWRERLAILLRGHCWLWVWSSVTQPPVRIDTNNPFAKPKKEKG